MSIERSTGVTRGLAMVALLAAALAFPPAGAARDARKVHVVQPGDSVAKVADFYGVSQRDLLEMNKLKKGRPLKVGQKLRIPNVLRVPGKRYKVKKGDTLASIAAKHRVDVGDLAHANKLGRDAALKIGRTLVVPDKRATTGKTIKIKDQPPVPILFLKVATGERERLQLYSKKGERIWRSVQRLTYLARDKRGKQPQKRVHFRLVEMLQRLAWEFPDTPIEIISGYRPQSSGNESQHAFGRALDIRMPGVSAKRVWQFCKSLPRAGCGYYPSDGFVHIDAREKSASWIDR